MIHRKYSEDLFRRMAALRQALDRTMLACRSRKHRERQADGRERLQGTVHRLRKRRRRDACASPASAQNRPAQYEEVVDMLHEHGISTWGSFVFGFDTDDRGGVRSHGRIRHRMKLTMALFAILTPYPGTQLYRRLKGRRPVDRRALVAPPRSRRRLAVFPPPAHDSRTAARGLDACLETVLLAALDPQALDGANELELDSVAGYLPLNLLQNRLANVKSGRGGSASEPSPPLTRRRTPSPSSQQKPAGGKSPQHPSGRWRSQGGGERAAGGEMADFV